MAVDQTPKEYVSKGYPQQQGTGVYLNLLEGGGTFVSFRQNETYDEAVNRSGEYAAFKWIPNAVANFADVSQTTCRIPGEPCEDTCTANGCICNPETKTCVDASQNGSGGSGGGQLENPGLGQGTRAVGVSVYQGEHRKRQEEVVAVPLRVRVFSE